MTPTTHLPRALAALALLSGLASAQATFHGLGSAWPYDLSADGSAASGDLNFTGYFRWTPGGGVVGIGGVAAGNGVGGQAHISLDGQTIAGTNLNGTSGLHEIAVYDVGSGTWSFKGGLGASSGSETSSGWDISGDGQTVVGLGWISAGGAHAVTWNSSTGVVDLGSTVPNRSTRANATDDDGSVVFGWQDSASGFRQGARWINGVQTLITQNGNMMGEVAACSADGTWAVGLGVGSNGWNPYRWSEAGGTENLGLLPNISNPRAGATSITADGQTVVGYVRPFGSPATFGRGFIWRPDLGMVDLTDYVQSLGVQLPAGYVLALPLAISADGTAIAGVGRTAGSSGFVITGLPALSDTYCTAQVNSAGCTPAIAGDGVASVSSVFAYDIGASQVLSNVVGLMIYSKSGAGSIPFNGGTICVGSPITRTSGQFSGGSGSCGGTFSFDFNAYIDSGFDPNLFAGAQVWAQYWSRDLAAPGGSNLSDALHFYVVP